MDLGHGGVETPAAKAIRLLGVKEIAYACDLTTNAVWKWETVLKGRVPGKHQLTVLELAKRLNKPLTAEDLIGVRAAA